MKMSVAFAAMVIIWGGLSASAECVGQNLIQKLPQETQAELRQAASKVPYPNGILWQATKGDAQITLVGTYHFPDPRHQQTVDRLAGPLNNAAALYVEASPEDQARLTKALTDDPSLVVATDGPKLSKRLSDKEWKILSTALSERGMPSEVAQNVRPWYASVLLSLSPCMLKQLTANGQMGGLDHLLIEQALSTDLPVHGLEPWDTVLSLFGDLTPKQEEDMIRASLPAAAYADDYAVTLTETYFSGEIWKIWEFGRFDAYENSGLSRQEVDEGLDFVQSRIMDQRNQNWIAPLIQGAEMAAKEGKGIVAGFGALHLPGKNGVLSLLKNEGWSIEPLN